MALDNIHSRFSLFPTGLFPLVPPPCKNFPHSTPALQLSVLFVSLQPNSKTPPKTFLCLLPLPFHSSPPRSLWKPLHSGFPSHVPFISASLVFSMMPNPTAVPCLHLTWLFSTFDTGDHFFLLKRVYSLSFWGTTHFDFLLLHWLLLGLLLDPSLPDLYMLVPLNSALRSLPFSLSFRSRT